MSKKENFNLDSFVNAEDEFNIAELLKDVSLPEGDMDITLDEILAEYGGNKRSAQKFRETLEEELSEPWTNEGEIPQPAVVTRGHNADTVPPLPRTEEEYDLARAPETEPPIEVPDNPKREHREEINRAPETEPQEETEQIYAPELPDADTIPADRAILIDKLFAGVVDSVLEEEEQKRDNAQPPARRRGLFSRRAIEDTEPFYEPPPPAEPPDEREEWETVPERDSGEATGAYHTGFKRIKCRMPWMYVLSLLTCAAAVADYEGLIPDVVTPMMESGALLALLILACILGASVFAKGFGSILHKKCTPELMVSVSCLVAAADCVTMNLFTQRCVNMPFVSVTIVCLTLIMRGNMLRLRGLRDTCRVASQSDTPYIINEVDGGIRKQRAVNDGFMRLTERESGAEELYDRVMPVILVATVVFAFLASQGQGCPQNFLWCWSAILSAATAFSFTSVFGAPLAKMAKRLKDDGCAVAAYRGAEIISRENKMILTDGDLFPPGTITMNGLKVYASDMSTCISYATSLIRESESGLTRIFEDLMRTQGGHLVKMDDFSFYKEGGISATISGESVVLGTRDFMARMGVRLPKELKVQTGILLAVDKQLTAVFAVKYHESDNVDTALRMVLRNRIMPVFAVRDTNITPGLLKRKFKIKGKCMYPELAERLALSEDETDTDGMAAAILHREGLMPYAEAVIAAKRLDSAVSFGSGLTLLSSICGALLSFYLAFVGGTDVLSAVPMLVYMLIWCVPAVMISGWVNRY